MFSIEGGGSSPTCTVAGARASETSDWNARSPEITRIVSDSSALAGVARATSKATIPNARTRSLYTVTFRPDRSSVCSMRLSCTLVLLGACTYTTPAAPPDGSPADPDGPPMVGPCESTGITCADDTYLATCTAMGVAPTLTQCSWGCEATGTAHCSGVVPSGGAVTAADMDPSTFGSVGDIDLPATTIDTDAGTIVSTQAVSGFEYHATATVGVFKLGSLHVTGPIEVVGTRALALIANGEITIDDTIDARGCEGTVQQPGPGGFAGANAKASATGSGAGAVPAAGKAGAGGGGYGGSGGDGGPNVATLGGTGGAPFGDDAISMLVGGGGGGGGPGGGGGVGGGGGGAVQLVSNTQITIGNTGGVDASGCGGGLGAGGGEDGAGGGGAGGAVLLEAPTIAIAGALAVNGGGGGGSGGSPGTDGSSGTLDRTRASGGAAGTGGGGGAIGGLGGAAATLAGDPGLEAPRSSGGGGGVGRIRLSTLGGVATVTGQLSPALDDNPTTCTEANGNAAMTRAIA